MASRSRDASVEVESIANDEELKQLFCLFISKKMRILYARIPAKLGVINPDASDPLGMSGGE